MACPLEAGAGLAQVNEEAVHSRHESSLQALSRYRKLETNDCVNDVD
jgi:hypothetical protein